MKIKRIAFIIAALCMMLFLVSCTDNQEQESVTMNTLPVLNTGNGEDNNIVSTAAHDISLTTENITPMTSSTKETGQNSIETNKPENIESPEDITETENDSAEDLPNEETEEIIESEFVIDIGGNAGVGGN